VTVDLAPLLKIVPIFAVALVVPGPDFLMISSMALSRGRAAGVMGAVGIAAGAMVWVLLCMFGLGVVLSHMHWLLTAVRMAGGLYLIYLGGQLWRASMKPQAKLEQTSVPIKNRNPFVMGLLTNLTNPKALAFFTSIFALTLPPEATLSTQMTIMTIMFAMVVGWFSIVTFGLSTPAMRKVYIRASKWIDRVAGTFLAFFGFRLLFSGRN
jgi:threonine efflux protein